MTSILEPVRTRAPRPRRKDVREEAQSSAAWTTPEGELLLEKLETGVYRLGSDDGVRGFVEQAGKVYVVLHGAVYATAVEVGQKLDFDEAVELLRELS
ncbi:hypothetical protein [Arenivirga flava]|uniref:Uncharacterized protein n=1 Tax=Arenivirga flava TaxID=1930060 RepID=A0AA37XCS0_9MICO|nr:hypothetical protein [Arenivirga flava]GMA28772.1 hypothetical protein GCM10025874_20250 [Arenivirga flava]